MSIYFQYPAMNDYPNLACSIKVEVKENDNLKDEGSLNLDLILELKDYLALKSI